MINELATPLYDINVVRDAFLASMGTTLRNRANDEAVHVRAALITILGQYSPALYASPDMMIELERVVFQNEPLRSWVFDMKFVFFMSIGNGRVSAMLAALINDIALASSEDMAAVAMSPESTPEQIQALTQQIQNATIMPKAVKEELPVADVARLVLTCNTWMIVLMLLHAFVDIEAEILQTPAAK